MNLLVKINNFIKLCMCVYIYINDSLAYCDNNRTNEIWIFVLKRKKTQ